MNSHEIKQAKRKAYYENKADQAREEADQARQRADKLASRIPFGQPILVGHHSEKHHRSDLDKIANARRQSIEALKKAAYYDNKASGVGKAGISRDDPDAIEKLKLKLAALEQERDQIKTARSDGTSDTPAYMLTNLSANIRYTRQRIAKLEAAAAKETRDYAIGEIKIIENVEANRLQIFFPGKPDKEIRDQLKSSGFRWASSLGCWQAYLNNRARWHVERIFKSESEE